mmetsp:Transcript_4039/g.7778  ORF Transcript_4039/g.7778 Transcript_4039/m.7778 type:complete len:117 (+) Transcript_4039:353-703(+)
MQATDQEIVQLRKTQNHLLGQLNINQQLTMQGILTRGQYFQEESSLEDRIAQTAKEIKAKENQRQELIDSADPGMGFLPLFTPFPQGEAYVDAPRYSGIQPWRALSSHKEGCESGR